MLHINLIAARRAERRRREMVRGVLVRGMVGVGLATVLTLTFMTVSIQIIRNRIADVDQQMAMLQDTVSRVERLQAAMGSLQPRVTTLLTAQNATNRWRAVLQEVSSSLPASTWITSFTAQTPPNEGFTITGQSTSQALVGRTMLQMNRKENIKDVTLRYTQANRTNSGAVNAINFELAGTLHPLEGSTPEVPTNGK